MSKYDDWLKVIEHSRKYQTQETLESLLNIIEEDKKGRNIDLVAEALGYFISDPEAKRALITLARHEDYLTRYEALGSLYFFYKRDKDPLIKQLMIEALSDPNEFVISEALDSIGLFGWKELSPTIKPFLNHKDEMVRGSAAVALGELGDKESINSIKRALKQETEDWAKLHYYQALYFLGEDRYFKSMMSMLKSSCHLTRSSAARKLEEVANEQNYYQIYFALYTQLKRERTILVASIIEKIMREIEDEYLVKT
ncbi:HEAT repeat domain-containing protein [Thermoflavimicrobium daqui]|uniref:HEAT repeat domain-containing protein n=1 Tax=Thermoflavimicrobium daqui TaxID=2137476 RepID=A0A364K1A8_9BACL|nr:HEAT repeat domain-containing protein [Thermoflavimicrobium daqui]RAL21479.1 hypothetical protein DL897_16110 [Thermoflavimicrobium daqui]